MLWNSCDGSEAQKIKTRWKKKCGAVIKTALKCSNAVIRVLKNIIRTCVFEWQKMLVFGVSACQLFHLRLFAGLELSKVAEMEGCCYRKLTMSYTLFHLMQTSVISFCILRPSFLFSFINRVAAVLWSKKVAILLKCTSSFATAATLRVFCAARLAVSF